MNQFHFFSLLLLFHTCVFLPFFFPLFSTSFPYFTFLVLFNPFSRPSLPFCHFWFWFSSFHSSLLKSLFHLCVVGCPYPAATCAFSCSLTLFFKRTGEENMMENLMVLGKYMDLDGENNHKIKNTFFSIPSPSLPTPAHGPLPHNTPIWYFFHFISYVFLMSFMCIMLVVNADKMM